MNLSLWALPASLAVAGTGVTAAVGMLLAHRRHAQEQYDTAEERAQLLLHRRQALQHRLAVIALAIGCLMMFVLAGIAAWLSFGAQRQYAHAHNGGDWEAATGFALLLDAGALSLSLIRFFEALTLRSSAITRVLLLAFVSASAAMNLLHAPEAGAGSAFLAMVPPLVYAVLLEMLLFKVEQVIMGRQKRRKAGEDRGYSLLLWLPWPVGAPVKLWKAWRTELLSTVENVRVTGSLRPLATAADPATAPSPSQQPTTAVPGGAELLPVTAVATVNALPAGVRPTARPSDTEPPLPSAPVGPVLQTTVAVSGAPAGNGMAGGTASSPARVSDPVAGPVAKDPEPGTAYPGNEAGARFEADADGQLKGAEFPGEPGSRRDDFGEAGSEEPYCGGSKDADAEHGVGSETKLERTPSGTSDDEVRKDRRVQIDLSTLPKEEGPRQLAERIYVAHHVAGLPLDKADLARWAGYTNPRSGGNEYRRLKREYGPILERTGAAYADLDWSSLDRRNPPVVSSGEAGGGGEQRVEQAQAA